MAWGRGMPDWAEILERDGPAVWRSAFRLLGDRGEADDCLQETFLAAVQVARREEVRCWRALLLRLVAARAVDRLRRRRRRRERPLDGDEPVGPGPVPSDRAEEAELVGRLREALALIPPRQAEVFCLRTSEGWSYDEIAGHLGISVASVGVLLHRARGRLRALLGAAPEPEEVP